MPRRTATLSLLRKDTIRGAWKKTTPEVSADYDRSFADVRHTRSRLVREAVGVRTDALRIIRNYKIRRGNSVIAHDIADRVNRQAQVRDDPVFAKLSARGQQLSDTEYRKRHFAIERLINRTMTEKEYHDWLDKFHLMEPAVSTPQKLKKKVQHHAFATPSKRRSYRQFWSNALERKAAKTKKRKK